VGHWMWTGLINIPLNGGWWSLHNQIIWALLILFVMVAGWFDLKARRVPNLLNVSAIILMLILQGAFRSEWSAIFALVVTALWMLVPTILRVWGQGDWKMSIVFGVALGVLPTLLIWLVAFVLVVPLRRISLQLSRRWIGEERAKSIPVASFVAVSTCGAYILLAFTA